MDATDAVPRSKTHLVQIFGTEDIRDLGLEEVRFEHGSDTRAKTSNLITPFHVTGRTVILDTFRSFVASAHEIPIAGPVATARPEFGRLGLTDAAIPGALDEATTLATDDLDLYIAGVTVGHRAIDFTQERAYRFP